MRPGPLFIIWTLLLDLTCSDPLPACSQFFNPAQKDAKDTSVTSLTCLLHDGGTIPIPEPNQRVCYRTCVRTYPNGTEMCEAQDQSVEPLPITLPSDPNLRGMYFTTRLASPGFFTNRRYKNNAICRYHVKCDPGQLLHFLIPSFSVEEPFGATCLDSLTIDRSLYGTKKTICGSLSRIDSDREDFNDGRLYVEFNTNRVVNDDGFYIAVTCVRPQFYNIPMPESDSRLRRVRRGTRRSGVRDHTPLQSQDHGPLQSQNVTPLPSHDHTPLPSHDNTPLPSQDHTLLPSQDHTPLPPQDDSPRNSIFRVRRRPFRMISVTIPSGASLLYDQKTIRVHRDNQWMYRLSNIEVLQVYNKAEGYLAFYGSAESRTFPGLGEMLVGVGVVHLIQTGVDPAFRLKLSDEDALELLYQELHSKGVFMNEDFDIGPRDESSVPALGIQPPPLEDASLLNITLPRQPSHDITPSSKKVDFKELALVYSVSENGVVRAAACLYLNKVLNSACVGHTR